MSAPLLSLAGVDLERGYRRLLTGVELQVGAGDLVQITGENGAGKTSLLRAIAGLARTGVTGTIERAADFLFLGHAPALKALLSPVDNLRWHPCGGTTAAPEPILAALSEVGLRGCEDTPLCQLSAGQQRRVALARLWLATQPLWLLDEPFTAIDVAGAKVLEDRIAAHADAGGAVVFTSHQANRFGERLRLLDLSRYAGS